MHNFDTGSLAEDKMDDLENVRFGPILPILAGKSANDSGKSGNDE